MWVTLRTESDHVGEGKAHLGPVPSLVDVHEADAGFDCGAVTGVVVVDEEEGRVAAGVDACGHDFLCSCGEGWVDIHGEATRYCGGEALASSWRLLNEVIG